MNGILSVEELRCVVRRHRPRRVTVGGDTARAAVAAIVEPRDDDLYLLFIHRAVDENDPWSGHMGFPGGFMDPRDPDLRATVEREVREEIGVDLARETDWIGSLDEIQGVARGRQLPLVISPFLFVAEGRLEPVPNEEVQGILWVPFGFLADPRNESRIEYGAGAERTWLPAYLYEGRTIWGLTFRMVQNLLEILDLRPHRTSA
jgi:8-oxo-dGTP pyrophosphatase MutT (NUDIX family)